jgi:hypothetical protein
MAFRNPRGPLFPSIKQPSGVHRVNHHPVGQHAGRSTESRRLCSINDGQLYFRRVDADPVQASICIETACHHAMLFLIAGIKEYSQWFLGRENNIPDALLRDFDRSDDELTQILRNNCPSQLPPTKSARG